MQVEPAKRRPRHGNRGGDIAEHIRLAVEQVVQHESEPEGGERQVEAVEPDGRDREQRADRHDNQTAQRERGEPGNMKGC